MSELVGYTDEVKKLVDLRHIVYDWIGFRQLVDGLGLILSIYDKVDGWIEIRGEFIEQAQALYDHLGDVPEWFKAPTNDLIKSWVDAEVWDEPNFYAILAVPTLAGSHMALIEVKSLTVRANYVSITTGDVDMNGTGAYTGSYPSVNGYKLNSLAIDTELQPSTEMTENDNCDWMITYGDEVDGGAASFGYGAFDNPAYLGMTANYLGKARADSYTYGTSYTNTANAGEAGVYLNNRVSPTYAEIVVNGNVGEITASTTAGNLPTRTIWLNALNRVGASYRNQSMFVAWGSFGTGLDSIRRDILSTSMMLWQDTLKRRKDMKTKQIVWEGNSFNVYWFQALQRGVQVGLGEDLEWHYESLAISGRRLSAINSEYGTKVTPLYNGTYTDNLFILSETVNDYTLGGDLASTKANHDSIIVKAKADGYRVVVLGGPVRKHQAGFHANVTNQTVLNLALDDFQRYIRDQASIQGYTYIEPPTELWAYRADYATDGEYDTACAVRFADPLLFELTYTHPTERACIDLWSPLITTAIQNLAPPVVVPPLPTVTLKEIDFSTVANLDDITTLTTGSTAMVLDAGYLKVSGSPSSLLPVTNNALLDYVTGLEDVTFEYNAIIKSHDNADHGMAIGFMSDVGVRRDVYYHYRKPGNGSDGRIFRQYNTATPTSFSGLVAPVIDDEYNFKINYNDNVVTVSITNVSSPETTDGTVTYSYLNTSGELGMESSRFGLFHVGGEHWIKNFKLTANVVVNSDYIVIGDSMMDGYCSTYDYKRMIEIIRNANPTLTFTKSSRQGDEPSTAVNKNEEFTLVNPSKAILFIGTNQADGSPGGALASYATMYSNLQAIGVTEFIHVNALPRGGNANIGTFNTGLNSAYSGDIIIDAYTVFDDGAGSLHADYDCGDTIHLNDLGNSILAGLINAEI